MWLCFIKTSGKVSATRIDLAGEIEAAGKDVERCKEGDHLFGTPGMAFGAHAEYTCVTEGGALAIKPADMNGELAASIFLGASTTLFYLRDRGNIQAGDHVLIQWASGALGTYAVQPAKYVGARVTGVCSN